ncbi:MAG: hypothetical protein Q7S88_02385 [Candidatus Daviesbacteria bacterium]|nr:hypothetical protein [Candidatus Daviesbacteria bacterium]
MSDGSLRSIEHAFPLQNLELEQTKIYWSRQEGAKLPTVITGFRDPGGANAHLPVIARLLDKANVCVLTDSRGQQQLEQSGLDLRRDKFEGSALLAASQALTLADVVLTGLSDNLGTELLLMANSQWDNLNGVVQRPLIIGLEDYPGANARWYFGNKKVPSWIVPDYLCVVNEWSKDEELKFLPQGFDPERVVITGQPSFDRLAKEDRVKIRRDVRQKLEIGESDIFVTYMGTVTTGDPIGETAKTLQTLVPILKSVDPKIRLALRAHPRDMTDPEVYNQAFRPMKDMRVDTTGLTTDQVGIASDLVISNGSTTGVDAVYRGIPSVNVFLAPNNYFSQQPQSHQEVLDKFPLPTVEDGASPLAINSQELGNILDKIFNEQSYVTKLKQKMAGWKVDGRATDRVTDLVLNIANEHFLKSIK